MSKIEEYRALLMQALKFRALGQEDEEDKILDQMDKIWFQLTQEEVDELNKQKG
jgi:hypothetical protein